MSNLSYTNVGIICYLLLKVSLFLSTSLHGMSTSRFPMEFLFLVLNGLQILHFTINMFYSKTQDKSNSDLNTEPRTYNIQGFDSFNGQCVKEDDVKH